MKTHTMYFLVVVHRMFAFMVSFKRHHLFRVLLNALIIFPGLGSVALSAFAADFLEGKLRAGGDHNYPPYEFFQDGRPTGFNIDILQAVSDVMGLEVEIHLGPWNESRHNLERGAIDLISGMFYSPERDREVDFSTPHIIVTYAMFVRKGSPIRSLEELTGKQVIVQEGDIMHDYARAHILAKKLIPVPDQADALQLLAAGRYDCALLAKLQGQYLIERFHLTNIQVVAPPIAQREYCFAVVEGNTSLQALLNEGLAILNATGRYRKIYEKWFGVESPPFSITLFLRFIVLGVALLGFLGIGASVLSVLLKCQINQRTQELSQELAGRKRMEKKFVEERNLLRTLIDNLPDCIYVKDCESRFVLVNTALVRLMAQGAPDDLLGKTDFDFYPSEIAQIFYDDERAVLGSGETLLHKEEMILNLQTHTTAWLATSKIALQDARGQIIGLVGIGRNITRDKLAKKALQEKNAQLESLLGSISDLVYFKDAEGRHLMVNKAFERFTGLAGTEILGKRDEQILPAELARDVHANDRNVLQERHPVRFEACVTAPDGTFQYFETIKTPLLDEENRLLGLVGVSRDVTERKQAEAALMAERASLTQRVEEQTAELRRANAELAQASRMKDEFLANMSHELRTPLNAILGMSEALLDGVYGRLAEGHVRSIKTIEESGRHLLTLINDILDLSKIEAGKMEVKIAPLIVEEVCQASLRFIRQSAQKKRLKVSFSLDSQIKQLALDERRLKQILVNLLGNAVKFTPEGGSIGLEVERDIHQQQVSFSVWDTGVGIAKDDLSKLFVPFTQLDARLSRKYEGTGLGLALVSRMVALQNGSIAVSSDEGKGSRFTVTFPWNASMVK